jgi:hypothetical protein
MRLWLSGPRVLGIRPGITFRPDELFTKTAPAKNPGGFVYVIRSTDNLVKVGQSGNPSRRLAELQTGSPAPLSFAYIGALKCDGVVIERAAHDILSAHGMQGDWFSCGADMAVAAVSMAAYRLGEPIASLDQQMADRVVAYIASDRPAPAKSHLFLRFFSAVVVIWVIMMYVFVL